MLTNCKNCGAVLHSCRCEYCGTIYNVDEVAAEHFMDIGTKASKTEITNYDVSSEDFTKALFKLSQQNGIQYGGISINDIRKDLYDGT